MLLLWNLKKKALQSLTSVEVQYKLAPSSPGPQCEFNGDPAQRAPRAGDGGCHGSVLPHLLAAVRRDGPAGHLRPPGPSDPRGDHHAVSAGQVLHRHQPFYLHIHEQTGETGGASFLFVCL